MSFLELGLRTELRQALHACGYKSPTTIPLETIPAIIRGHDVLAGAQTRTGKTAAFAFSILELLCQGRASLANGARPRALILTPPRELAVQVCESTQRYGSELNLRVGTVLGGVNIKPQVEMLTRGIDILVATPGRLLDLETHGHLDLRGIEILVLDEADRMLDMGFIHDIRRILKLLPTHRQNLLFSATYSKGVRSLASRLLDNPALIDVAPRNVPAQEIDQHRYHVENCAKRHLLTRLIKEQRWTQVLLFPRTEHGANRLAKQLSRDGLHAMAIHGNKSQNSRTQALDGFKNGAVRILVATDIVARGLDIDSFPCVINFDLPNSPEDYVHRIGRTGRAGRGGTA